ncbi:MAG TPA: hypothetical protein VKP58_00570 [Candidatus Acidoferrum sp.]|nr:hypothetical protein [Candidatus Acidoferrum sp.]
MNSHIRKLSLASALALVAALAVATPSFAQAQNDSSESVAEAARKAKERKKASPKDNRVITNDTIELRPASADTSDAPPAGTVVTTTPVATPSGTAATATSASAPAASADVSATAKPAAATASDAKKKEEAAAAAAKTKELLAQAQDQLDVLKRELALDSDSFFSNPDYAHDASGKSKLDELKQSIGDKQISVEELKQQLAELMEKAGISGDEVKPPAPQR